MGNIHYDPERILNGFTEDGLKELAKRLKRRIRVIKSDIIHDILSPPKGKPEDRVKVWQEINRNLRKQLEGFSKEEHEIFSLENIPLEEQFKVSYMFTLSLNPAIKAMGEKLYCQAEENRLIEKAEKDKGDDKGERDEIDNKDEEDAGDEEALAVLAVITTEVETKEVDERTQTKDKKALIEAQEVIEPIFIEVNESIEDREIERMQEVKRVKDNPESVNRVFTAKKPSMEHGKEETMELQKRVRILEKKLKTINSEGLKTKGQLEKVKSDLVVLKAQWLKEKEQNEKYRNRVRDLEVERIEKDKEIDMLKRKLEYTQNDKQSNVKVEHCGEIDLAAFQGRKALIFAEHDNDVDIRLNALGIIPIWAMEIDWNRPRRRMSTCQIVLYKMNNEKLNKLDEIRDIARYLNIPCDELLDV